MSATLSHGQALQYLARLHQAQASTRKTRKGLRRAARQDDNAAMRDLVRQQQTLLDALDDEATQAMQARLGGALSRCSLPSEKALASAPACLLERYEERWCQELDQLREGEADEVAQRRAWGQAVLWFNTPRWVQQEAPEGCVCLGYEYQGHVWAMAEQTNEGVTLEAWDGCALRKVSASSAQGLDLLRWADVILKNNRRLRLRLPAPWMGEE